MKLKCMQLPLHLAVAQLISSNFLEAMQQGFIEMGLDENQSRELVQQAMLGSAKLVIENPQTALSTLRENVTSKAAPPQPH